MHGIKNNVKLGDFQQATIVNLYKNTKDKVLRTNAAIWFNEICTAKHLAPK